MKLPAQSPPVGRTGPPSGAAGREGTGVMASQTACGGLTGLAQQMCYAMRYGLD
jgi:hypothetical protein